MDRLSPELILLVLEHLGQRTSRGFPTYEHRVYTVGHRPLYFPKLAPLAVLSRDWQQCVETLTFKSLTLSSVDLITGKPALILTPSRLRILKHVSVYIGTSRVDADAACVPKDVSPSVAGHTVFHKTIKALFSLLKTLDAHHAGRPVSLKLAIEPEPMWGSGRRDVWGMRDEPGFFLDLDLNETGPLPKISSIGYFNVAVLSRGRLFAPRTFCHIAHAFPQLEDMTIAVEDMEQKDTSVRPRMREELAAGLEMLPCSITSFQLELQGHDAEWEFDFVESRVVPPDEDGKDPLSRALGRFSLRPGLEQFVVSGSVDDSILHPGDALDSGAWASMKTFALHLSVTAPNGHPLMRHVDLGEEDAKPDEPDLPDDSPEGRQKAIEELPPPRELLPDEFSGNRAIVEPFFIWGAKAAGKMPALKSFFIQAGDNDVEILLEFNKQGELELAFAPIGHPGEALIEPWREAARKHEKELVVFMRTFQDCPWGYILK